MDVWPYLTDVLRRIAAIAPGDTAALEALLPDRRLAAYALPTEAQREYACRAGTTTAYSFGDDAGNLGDYAWWGGAIGDGNAGAERYPHRVGQKKPNPWGLYDMHGNVWEWCRDAYAKKLPGGTDPLVETGSDRVFRAGAG